MIILLTIIAVLLAANIVISYLNADTVATAILMTTGKEKALPKPIFKPKPKEPTPEEIKYSKILANIDAYDGTSRNQVKT
jgi:hypothetical protein